VSRPVRLTRRGRIAATIATTLGALLLAGLASLDVDADAAPVPVGPVKTAPAFDCRDRIARVLHGAGFRGQDLRTAYAVVMRESHGQSLDESSPWYTGGLGWFQIQTSAHSSKAWWSRSAMLDPERQARIVYRHMTDKGRNWAPWGLTRDGQLDPSQYANWSSWQHEAWIMAPFRKYAAAFDRLPKGCRS
jgi:hypothetical protein